MSRNMYYDESFTETRNTLLVEEINHDDLTRALAGTLSNCILLKGRVDTLNEKYTHLEKEVSTLKKQVGDIGKMFGCYLPEKYDGEVKNKAGETQTDYKDLCIKMYGTLRELRELIKLKTEHYYNNLTDEKVLK